MFIYDLQKVIIAWARYILHVNDRIITKAVAHVGRPHNVFGHLIRNLVRAISIQVLDFCKSEKGAV